MTKPQFTLHKLPEGFVVTSDQKDTIGYLPVVLTRFNELEETADGYDVYDHIQNGSKIVIALPDQIDFSSLSPEIQKEIGWFDVDKLALDSIGVVENDVPHWRDFISNEDYSSAKGFKKGFQKALELLSDMTFTKKDMFKLMEHLRDTESRMMFEVETRMFVSKPKSWKVELEMETVKGEYIGRKKIGVTPSGEPTYINEGYEEKEVPKLTDGKIKLLKLL